MEKNWKLALTGLAGGAVNGCFGGGGGMVLIPLLNRWCGVEERRSFANCVAIVLPLCVLSVMIYAFRDALDLAQAWPYLLGGLAGGLIGGKIFGKVPVLWLRRIFAAFLLYGGIRYLL